ncbi:MAG: hypothetical protein MZV64_63820 [Ignavibacteriales bacterium]|nr:hypothetical protein [Ignavibacteriales bacterium]
MADDDDVGVALEGADGVGQALALGHRRVADLVDVDDVAAEPLHGRDERGGRPGRRLVEDRGQDLAFEQVERADPLDHDPHFVGHAEDVLQVGAAELLDRDDVLAVPGRGALVAERQMGVLRGAGHGGSPRFFPPHATPAPEGSQRREGGAGQAGIGRKRE